MSGMILVASSNDDEGAADRRLAEMRKVVRDARSKEQAERAGGGRDRSRKATVPEGKSESKTGRRNGSRPRKDLNQDPFAGQRRPTAFVRDADGPSDRRVQVGNGATLRASREDGGGGGRDRGFRNSRSHSDQDPAAWDARHIDRYNDPRVIRGTASVGNADAARPAFGGEDVKRSVNEKVYAFGENADAAGPAFGGEGRARGVNEKVYSFGENADASGPAFGRDGHVVDAAKVHKQVLRMRTLLDTIHSALYKYPHAPPPTEATAELHRLLHAIGAFSSGISKDVWVHALKRPFVDKIIGRGEPMYYVRRNRVEDGGAAASTPSRHYQAFVVMPIDRKKYVLHFIAKGLLRAGFKGEESYSDSVNSLESQPSNGSSGPVAPEAQNDDDEAGLHKQVLTTAECTTSNVPAIRPATQRKTSDDNHDMPISVPYTTAASEFLYGTNVVLAALRARRRRLHHLYISPRAYTRETGNAQDIIDLARRAGIPVEANADLRLLDKMADNRAHNGVVLEASRIPAPPVLALAKPDARTSIVPLSLERQSAEDVAVNGAPAAIPASTVAWRQPFVVMLDGITDPGNLGNILRTAHFYGVDAVAVATNTCAPLTSAVLAKASSGACEAVRILALPKPSNFVFESAKAGWRIYAAVAAPATPNPTGASSGAAIKEAAKHTSTARIAASGSPLAKHPCILMLGAEGEGLRANLTAKADAYISIESGARDGGGGGSVDVGVDSLNVGVAAGVLMEAFLRRPADVPAVKLSGGSQGELGF